MKKSSLTSRLIPVFLLAALLVVCGTVYAYMFKQSGEQTVTFTPAQVSCTAAVKDGKVTVTNTSNINAYLRVRLVGYWVDNRGNIVAKSAPTLTVNGYPGWKAGSDNTYYCEESVAAETTVTLGSVATDESDGTYKVAYDILAEAIQADPPEAASGSWGVSINAQSKEITSVP